MTLLISKDFLEEIGRVAVLQSHIEGGLAIVIANLAGVSTAVGDVIAKRLSFRHLSEIASELLHLQSAKLSKKHVHRAVNILDRAVIAEQQRNMIVHSMWTFATPFDQTVASRVKLSGKPAKLNAVQVRLDELRALRTEMESLSEDLTYIHPHLRVHR
jgi:hypothetical protein